MVLINNQEELNELCDKVSEEEWMGMDTEFMRRTTYFARLCIVQIITPGHQIVIDTLTNLDLTPLRDILINERILKIVHSPREDFDIFYHLFKIIPKNVFDTQTAAQVCGIGDFISYGDLCYKVLGVDIDKKHQTSDWLKRPLSQNMLDYAIKDVWHLKELYEFLSKELVKKDLLPKYQQKMNMLLAEGCYTVNLNNIWKKVKFTNHSALFINNMQILAAFREESAIRLNVPRRHFASDEDLIKICNNIPQNERLLSRLKLTSKYLRKSPYKDRLLELCAGLGDFPV